MLEFRDTTVRDADGKIVAIEGIGKDVTLRHRAEETLRKAHEELERRVQERTAELTAKNEQLRESQERYLVGHSGSFGVYHPMARRRGSHVRQRVVLFLCQFFVR